MVQQEQYLLGQRAAEQERLRQQPKELETEARWLLSQLGIQPGWRAIDIGCGPQGVLNLLSNHVGLQGSVVGLEMNETSCALAHAFVEEHHLTNVEVLQGDIRTTDLPKRSFDLAHLRLVLVNVPDPEWIIAELGGLWQDEKAY